MSITIRDVAAEAGVSIATVSKVMNGKDSDIAKATRKRVLEVASKMGYRSNALARGLRTRKTNTIGFILPNYTSSLFGPMIGALDETISDRGYTLTVMSSHNDLDTELEVVRKLSSMMVDGIIVYRIYAEEAQEILNAANCPIVFIDRFPLPIVEGTGQVYIHTSAAVMECVYTLVRTGSKHIAMLCNSRERGGVRFAAFREALRNSGLEYDDRLVVEGPESFAMGRKAMKDILDAGIEIDGAVCGSDLVAEGALTAMRDHGLSMPKDIRLIAASISSMTSGFHRPFSCVSMPSSILGRMAGKMMIDHLENETPLSTIGTSYTVIPGGAMGDTGHINARAATYLMPRKVASDAISEQEDEKSLDSSAR